MDEKKNGRPKPTTNMLDAPERSADSGASTCRHGGGPLHSAREREREKEKDTVVFV